MNGNKNNKASIANKGSEANQHVVIGNRITDRIKAVRLIMANKELAYQNEAREKCASDLIAANEEIVHQNEENESYATELILAREELAYQNEEKEKRAAELLTANKELAFSNAELEQFIFVASHDLQEPLRMITGFMAQLEKKYGDIVDEKGRQYINFAMDGAKRMRQIILDLLSFSVAGSVEDDIEDVDSEKLINEIITHNWRQAEELKASFNLENLPVMQTYKKPLRQIFQNLVGNSLKYHKQDEPPVISITCKQTKTHFQFAVEDNGIGIAPEYFDKIFIIFQRLHNKDEYSGTGMGLALTKKIVENLGGKIWVESIEGKGSTFYFTILKKQENVSKLNAH